MLLKRVEITDFLSVKGTLPIDIDRRVTTLLGSNDHGKSNVLRAIEHLNDNLPISEDEANWDAAGMPAISFTFSLTAEERAEWKAIVETIYARITEAKAKNEASDAGESEGENDEQQAAMAPGDQPTARRSPAKGPGGKREPEPERPELPESSLNPAVDLLTLSRNGVGAPLAFDGTDVEDLPDEMVAFFEKYKPRVELFRAMSGSLQDSTTADTIATDEFEFLQGVFFYAGLDPQNSKKLFTQDDMTIRVLDTASKKLDNNLRRLWGQGTELHFELRHKGGEILFLADDPAIKSRKARMSKRSAGVTQFFRVSMMLYARRKKNPANSYISSSMSPGSYCTPRASGTCFRCSSSSRKRARSYSRPIPSFSLTRTSQRDIA